MGAGLRLSQSRTVGGSAQVPSGGEVRPQCHRGDAYEIRSIRLALLEFIVRIEPVDAEQYEYLVTPLV